MPTVATLVFGLRAWREVIPRRPDQYPWDWFVPYLSLGCGLVVVWLGLSVICAGVRVAVRRLHWVLRWLAYVVLIASASAVPLLLLVPMLIASKVCGDGCDVGANWEGFIMVFDIAIQPNLVWWPVISVMTVTSTVLMVHIERRLINSRK